MVLVASNAVTFVRQSVFIFIFYQEKYEFDNQWAFVVNFRCLPPQKRTQNESKEYRKYYRRDAKTFDCLFASLQATGTAKAVLKEC